MYEYEIKLYKKNFIPGIVGFNGAKKWVIKNVMENNAFETSAIIGFAAEKPIGYSVLSRGDSSHTIVNFKGILAFVSNTQSESVAVFHNHPYGGFAPSKADIEIFYKIKRVLETIGTELMEMGIVYKSKSKNILDWYYDKNYFKIFEEARKKFWWDF